MQPNMSGGKAKMGPLNIGKLDERFIWRDRAGLITQSLDLAAGSERIYVNIDQVPLHAFSTKYHRR